VANGVIHRERRAFVSDEKSQELFTLARGEMEGLIIDKEVKSPEGFETENRAGGTVMELLDVAVKNRAVIRLVGETEQG